MLTLPLYDDRRPTFRFAPSPNGELHLGHALSAIVGFAAAQKVGGRFLVRIEDIDIGRTRPEFVAWILEDLAWLGLTWEEPVVRQSDRFPLYRAAVERLEALGVVYPCFATRAEIAAASERSERLERDPDGAPIYPGIYRDAPHDVVSARLASGEPFALRLDMRRALEIARRKLGGEPLYFREFDEEGHPTVVVCRPERWGDVVVARKDVPTSYHLAVVVDDAAQEVTHVTRGRDLFAATDLQRLLQVLLDLPAPVYHHHRLLTDETGRKLSKSARDVSFRMLRNRGATPDEIRRRIFLTTDR